MVGAGGSPSCFELAEFRFCRGFGLCSLAHGSGWDCGCRGVGDGEGESLRNATGNLSMEMGILSRRILATVVLWEIWSESRPAGIESVRPSRSTWALVLLREVEWEDDSRMLFVFGQGWVKRMKQL